MESSSYTGGMKQVHIPEWSSYTGGEDQVYMLEYMYRVGWGGNSSSYRRGMDQISYFRVGEDSSSYTGGGDGDGSSSYYTQVGIDKSRVKCIEGGRSKCIPLGDGHKFIYSSWGGVNLVYRWDGPIS